MLLAVEKAKADDLAFAWPMYRDFIVTNIHRRHNISTPIEEWVSTEEGAFQKLWSEGGVYVISVDGSRIGWLSAEESSAKVSINNVFIAADWQKKGVGEKIIEQITPKLRAEGKAVEIPVLTGAPIYPGIERSLTNLGFSAVGDDGPHRIFSAV